MLMSQESTIDSVHYSKAAHQQRRNNDNKRGTSQNRGGERGKEEKPLNNETIMGEMITGSYFPQVGRGGG
jgi:hypothetical protein